MGRKSGIYPHTWISGPDPVDHKLYNDCLRARAQANFRGEVWLLSEKEYISLWRENDAYKLKGRGTGSLCLIRIDIEGPWRLNNVEIVERIKHFRRSGRERLERMNAR